MSPTVAPVIQVTVAAVGLSLSVATLLIHVVAGRAALRMARETLGYLRRR
ncbi:MAG TPA: hypothetical protein VFX49_05505 [Chloroflexota bacterium]|nr:hypothetical protein [Chloroflexota bacterium]